MERINKSTSDLPDGGLRVAAAVYITDVRPFVYGEKDERGVRLHPKTACELVVDLDGDRYKFVKWPDRETGELDPRFNLTLKDAIGVLVLTKYKPGKSFSVEDIEIMQAAPSEDKPDPEPEETPQ
jgi:hypothetical protein